MLHKIILDTDIGDDIDDAIALALGVKCPELDVKGVVTTYRNSVMRSKIAKAILEELGKETVPVVQRNSWMVSQRLIRCVRISICHCRVPAMRR